MIDYATMKREWPKLKAALTRAKNRKDPAKIVEVCDKAFALFDKIGYPDDWHLFKVAKEDAEFAQGRRFTWPK